MRDAQAAEDDFEYGPLGPISTGTGDVCCGRCPLPCPYGLKLKPRLAYHPRPEDPRHDWGAAEFD